MRTIKGPNIVSSRHLDDSLKPQAIRSFRNVIYRHYAKHGRKLPWRKTKNPYHVLVSEVMLQQTQVSRVLTKYALFLEKFPDFQTLSRASLRDVLKAWQGLGYNRRALALLQTAQIVVNRYRGKLPSSLERLMALPGIGKATACAVLAFAFNRPTIFIETNIRAVFLHFFFSRRESVKDTEILPLVAKTLDRAKPRAWYHALMDYGVLLKRQYPNLGRKSAHHGIQSPFHGSDREVRSAILRLLTVQERVVESRLIQTLSVSRARAKGILRQLEKEGFIRRLRLTYSLAETSVAERSHWLP